MKKSDFEIKEFIDNREVLTQSDLIRFMYNKTGRITNGTPFLKNRVKRWWDYVLGTKDWVKLKEYREHIINTGNKKGERIDKVRKIYQTDKRLQEFGKRRIRNLLIEVYDLDIPLPSLARYIKELKQESNQCTVKSS